MEIFAIIVFVGFIIFFIIGTFYLLQGPFFVPSNDDDTRHIVSLVKKYKRKYVIDLGAGDGKLLTHLAKHGIKVDGVEILPHVVAKGKKRIKKEKLTKKANLQLGNMWTTNIEKYDCVVFYLTWHVMKRMEKKLQKELKPGAIVISNYATFPTWKPLKKEGRITVYKI